MSTNSTDLIIFVEKKGEDEYLASLLDINKSIIAKRNFKLTANSLKMEEDIRLLELATLDMAPNHDFSPKKFGFDLFETILGKQIGNEIKRRINIARSQNKRLRLKMYVASDADNIASLPLEYLFDGNNFLSNHPGILFSRLPNSSPKTITNQISFPLRALVVVSHPEDLPDEQVLSVQREQEVLLSALDKLVNGQNIEIDWVETSSLKAIQDYLTDQDYHIVHFIGHSAYDKDHDENYFILEDENSKSQKVPYSIVASLLAAYSSVRLVVLNICNSDSHFLGTIQKDLIKILFHQNVTAVILMQFPIRDESAINFTHQFYKSLSRGKTIDLAMAEARTALQMNGFDFGTPVLFLDNPTPLFSNDISSKENLLSRSKSYISLGGINQIDKGFFGRRREMISIIDGFKNRSIRGIIIFGLGGIGKSVLASKAAMKLTDYFEGILGIQCTPSISAEEIMSEIYSFLLSINLPVFPEWPDSSIAIVEKINVLLSIMTQHRLLLILDSFEQCLNDAREIINSGLSLLISNLFNGLAQGSKIVITSRYDFSPFHKYGELASEIYHMNIAELAFPSAVQLITRFKSLVDIPLYSNQPFQNNEIGSKEDIYKMIGGNPYAINLYGHLADKIGFSNARIIFRMVNQEMVEYVLLDQIINHLSLRQQKILISMSVYDEPVPIDGLIFLSRDRGMSYVQFIKVIRELVEFGIIITDENGDDNLYSLHTLVKEFVKTKSREEETKENHLHAAHYYMNGIIDDLSDGIEKVEAENIQANERVLGEAMASTFTRVLDQNPQEVWRVLKARAHYLASKDYLMAQALTLALYIPLHRWGFNHLVLDLLNESLTLPDIGSYRTQMNGFISAIYKVFGEYGSAIQLLEEACQEFQSIGEQKGYAYAMNNLGEIYIILGDYKKALNLLKKSIEIKAAINDQRGLITSCINISSIFNKKGKYLASEQYLNYALQKAIELENKPLIALCQGHIGSTLSDFGKYDQAKKYLDDCLSYFQQVNDKENIASITFELADIQRQLGNIKEARKLIEESQEICDEIGDKTGYSLTLIGLAAIHEAEGHFAESADNIEKALKLFQETGVVEMISACYQNLGLIREKQELYSQAIHEYNQGLGLAKQIHLSTAPTIEFLLFRTKIKKNINYLLKPILFLFSRRRND